MKIINILASVILACAITAQADVSSDATLRVVDSIYVNVVQTNIPATSWLSVDTDLAGTCYALKVFDTTNSLMEISHGQSVAAENVVDGHIGLNEKQIVPVKLHKGQSTMLRSMNGSAITTGVVSIDCLGL